MTAYPDLHPDDLAARQQLIGDVRQLRRDSGLTLTQISDQLGGIAKTGVLKAEAATNWRIVTIQRLARVYGMRLHVDICGINLPDDGDPIADVYARMHPTAPQAQDELARLVLVNGLRRIRHSYGWSARAMAVGLGVTENAVLAFEQCAPGVMFAPTQRYARVLEGWLGFRLERAAAPVLAGVA